MLHRYNYDRKLMLEKVLQKERLSGYKVFKKCLTFSLKGVKRFLLNSRELTMEKLKNFPKIL